MSLIDDFRNGKRYGTDWKAPTVQHMNNLVETVSNDDLIVQSIASTVDTSEADNYGIASVAMIGEGTEKYLKFKNLKGKGIKSIAYTSTDSKGNRIYTVTMDDNSSYTIQSDKGTGFNPRGTWTSGTAYVRDTNTIDTVFYNGSSYYCKTSHTASSTILPTNTTYWGMLAEQGQAPSIIDNLTTPDSTKALSANQGKLLNDEITNIKNGITRVEDTKKIQGIDFTENTVAKFGDYTIQKKRVLYSNSDGITVLNGNTATITLSQPVAVGDTLEVVGGSDVWKTGTLINRFRVTSLTAFLGRVDCFLPIALTNNKIQLQYVCCELKMTSDTTIDMTTIKVAGFQIPLETDQNVTSFVSYNNTAVVYEISKIVE